MTSVVFRPEAEADLTAIAVYVAQDSVDAALGLVDRLRRRCEILRTMPNAGPLRPDLGDGIRALSERPYVILYRYHQDRAEILAIVHGARDLPGAFRTPE